LERWPITLDAAATAESRIVEEYIGPDHPVRTRRDALTTYWPDHAGEGVVWINPPYRPVLLRRFLSKAVETATAGTPVVALIPASTGSIWWHENVVNVGAEVEFLQGRLRFGGPHSGGGPAPFSSALVHWGRGA
jgi:hypothetical protein